MFAYNLTIKGLTSAQVILAREKYGQNILNYEQENSVLEAIKNLAKEPMIILPVVASLIYFVNGKTGDGIFLSSAIVIVSVISLFQESRSRNALQKLKNFTQPNCKVIRNGKIEEIKSEELVVGDSLIVEEGTSITADGIIVHSNDFSVNESILTGESSPVFKDKSSEDNYIFTGTTVASGLAIVTIKNIGNETRLGKIGKSLESIQEEKTPLELQVNNFVKKLVIAGSIVFVVVWDINYFHSYNLLDSLLKALTLASFYYSIFTTLRYKNKMVLLIIATTITITGLLLFVPPLTTFFEFETLTFTQLFTCIGIGFISVIWYEFIKIKKRLQANSAGT